jgi:SAM-dependent methyltransferase
MIKCKRFFRLGNRIFQAAGVDIKKLVLAIRGTPRFLVSRYLWAKKSRVPMPECSQIGELYPQLSDWSCSSGSMSSVYFLQDLYFSKKIYQARPCSHLDVGSRLDGFVAQLAVFMAVDVMDLRPNKSTEANINFVVGDVTKPSSQPAKLYDSVSSLHVVEHIGLGRYGDEIDPDGHRKAINGLQQRLRPGGLLYISVPVGEARIEFNAHRIFDAKEFHNRLMEQFELKDYALIDDSGNIRPCDPSDEQIHNKLHFGCGLWTVQKAG